jgi:hypothetical protein
VIEPRPSSDVAQQLTEARELLKWVFETSRAGCFSRKRSERDRALSDINYRTEKYCK